MRKRCRCCGEEFEPIELLAHDMVALARRQFVKLTQESGQPAADVDDFLRRELGQALAEAEPDLVQEVYGRLTPDERARWLGAGRAGFT
jgi:hypothetical protein